MSASFKVASHATRPVEVIEVWAEGKMVAVIYPEEGANGIRVISSHLLWHEEEVEISNVAVHKFRFDTA